MSSRFISFLAAGLALVPAVAFAQDGALPTAPGEPLTDTERAAAASVTRSTPLIDAERATLAAAADEAPAPAPVPAPVPVLGERAPAGPLTSVAAPVAAPPRHPSLARRAVEVSLGFPVKGSVEVPTGDVDETGHGMVFDAAVLWRLGPLFHLGGELGYSSWSNHDTAAADGDDSGLVHAGLLGRWVLGSSQVTPFFQVGVGLCASEIGDGFVVERDELGEDTAFLLDSNGLGYTVGFGGGVRVAIGDSALFVVQVGADIANMYHRTRLERGDGSSTESEMSITLAQAQLRAGLALPF